MRTADFLKVDAALKVKFPNATDIEILFIKTIKKKESVINVGIQMDGRTSVQTLKFSEVFGTV